MHVGSFNNLPIGASGFVADAWAVPVQANVARVVEISLGDKTVATCEVVVEWDDVV